MSATESINSVKQIVAQQLRIPVDQQRLVFKGKTLLGKIMIHKKCKYFRFYRTILSVMILQLYYTFMFISCRCLNKIEKAYTQSVCVYCYLVVYFFSEDIIPELSQTAKRQVLV